MRRRDFLALSGAAVAAAFPRVALGQQRLARVGVLSNNTIATFGPIREALRALGYVEGQNIVFEIREAMNQANLLAGMAAELVALKPDVILAGATQAAQAAKNATTQIPIIMWAGDPVAVGLVPNLVHPGGNITGMSAQGVESTGRLLSVVHDLVPGMHSVAVLANLDDAFAQPFIAQVQSAAPSVRTAVEVEMIHGGSPVDGAFAAMVRNHADAVIIQFSLVSQQAIDAALNNRLPSFSNSGPSFATNGGLVAYLANVDEEAQRLAYYVDLILKGAKPGDIPIQQPTRFDMAINLKTAKALGLAVPQVVLIQATTVIE